MASKTLAALMAQLPPEAVERTKGSQTGRGYDTTGYGYQFIVNRMNEVLGIAGWSETYEIRKEVEGKWKNDKPWYEITVSCRVDFTDPETKEKSWREACGWHKASAWGDALKGAQTNALKKTASKIGPGWQAYADAVDDDNEPITDPEERPTAQQIQREAARAEPEKKSSKREIWDRIKAAIAKLGDGDAARILGCAPAKVSEWEPKSEAEAVAKMTSLETAATKRGAAA